MFTIKIYSNYIMNQKDIDKFFKQQVSQKTVIDSGTLSNLSPADFSAQYTYFSDIKHLDIHEICVTFKPKYHHFNSSILHHKFKDFIKNYSLKYAYFKPVYIFIPEFNSSGILHYHGIIYFDNANDYWTADLKRVLNTKFGRTIGKKVHKFKNYWAYIMKDIHKGKLTIGPFTNVKG